MGWEFLLLNGAALISVSPSLFLSMAPLQTVQCICISGTERSPVTFDCNYNHEFQKACEWFWAL